MADIFTEWQDVRSFLLEYIDTCDVIFNSVHENGDEKFSLAQNNIKQTKKALIIALKKEKSSKKEIIKKESLKETKPDDGKKAGSDDFLKQAKTWVENFNRTMKEANASIPHQCGLTARRKSAIRARVAEYGWAALYEMTNKASESRFLNGGGNHAFVATIDWLLRPNNFPKVIEGNYDNNRHIGDRYNGNQQQGVDPRRGTEPDNKTAEEYKTDF